MPIRTALILLAIVSPMGMPYTVLMPVIAAEVLHGGPNTLGIPDGARPASARWPARSIWRRGSRWSASAASSSIGPLALRREPGRVLAVRARSGCRCVLLAVVGAGFMVQMAVHQHDPPDDRRRELRGRVMAFYTMAFLGTAPIGSLLAGVLGRPPRRAEATIGSAPSSCIAAGPGSATKLPSLRVLIRPIYIERGIIAPPAVDPGAPTP